MKETGKILIDWYGRNKRELPWRQTGDPYKIWLSEIILQQTRVNQGTAYYLKFTEKYPDVNALAAASPDELFKLWQGLGYYNRAENLLKAARIVVEQYDGKLPRTVEQLKTLPGIGDYTAAAIASIAFGQPVPVLDGNVYRWLSRMFMINVPVNTDPAKKVFGEIAAKLMEGNPPGTFNQAAMEFGALSCTPDSPGCSRCVFKTRCKTRLQGVTQNYPVKKPKNEVKPLYLHYYFMETSGGNIILNKREKSDIWKNLYDFPSEVLNRLPSGEDSFPGKSEILSALHRSGGYFLTDSSPLYTHRLTHRIIFARFFRIKINNPPPLWKKSLLLIDKNELKNYPVPRLIERYLQDQKVLT